MESLRCQSEEHWSSQTSSLPLESDSAILEFLGAFNYDVDYAWFYLWGTLSQGKGIFKIVLIIFPFSNLFPLV